MENKPLNRIKVMLAERMMSNKQLAEKLGKDPATVSKWVTNTSQPTLENLRCLWYNQTIILAQQTRLSVFALTKGVL